MATKICFPVNEVWEKNVEKVEVPSGATLSAGDVIIAETLKSGSRSIYAGAQLTDITTQYPCIVITQDVYEDSDGRRPAGHPNVGEITYTSGKVVSALRLEPNMKLKITNDCLDNTGVVTPAAGVYLIPQNSDYQLKTSATIGTAVAALIIDGTDNTGMGGNFGATYADGVIARVVLGR